MNVLYALGAVINDTSRKGYSNAVILNFIGPFKISTDHYHTVVDSVLCACVYKQDGFAH